MTPLSGLCSEAGLISPCAGNELVSDASPTATVGQISAVFLSTRVQFPAVGCKRFDLCTSFSLLKLPGERKCAGGRQRSGEEVHMRGRACLAEQAKYVENKNQPFWTHVRR